MPINLFKGGITKLKNISLGQLVLLVQLFVFINTSLFFAAATELWKGIVSTYLLFVVAVFALPDLKEANFRFPLLKILPRFLLFFFGTLIILGVISGLLVNSNYLKLDFSNIPIGLILLQVFFVAVIEETVFRDVIAGWFGVIIASILFALFHYVVYQGNIITLLIAFGAGLLFSYIKLKFGKNVDSTPNMAVHAAINLHLLGITKIILGGG